MIRLLTGGSQSLDGGVDKPDLPSQCVYKLIQTSENLCRDVELFCGEIPESINLFKLRYCTLNFSLIFYTFLVSSNSHLTPKLLTWSR